MSRPRYLISQAIVWTLTYLALWRDVAGALNVLDGLALFALALAAITALSPDLAKSYAATRRAVPEWLSTHAMIARVLVLLWFDHFGLAALTVAAWLVLEAVRHGALAKREGGAA